jgi:DtxR family Mn-dependent transcriptional regulator
MTFDESHQELLEQLWIAVEEDERGGLPVGEAEPECANDLIRQGVADRVGGSLILTPAGRPHAAQAVRRYRLAERLVADVLATERSQVDSQACRLEHGLLDGVDDAICTLLGHPQFCPHGKPIPPGDCCEQMRSSIRRLIAPLCDLQPGEGGQIAYLHMKDAGRPQKLMAMGVLPGVPIKLVRRFPSYVFEAGYSQFAVDEAIAGDIFVRLVPR